MKKCVKLLVFSALLLIGIRISTLLLYPYNDIVRNWMNFYTLDKNTVDILIVGSSHAYASFDSVKMTEQTGEKTYILGSNSQVVKQTYFNVKEVLKCQNPKAIIFEAFSLSRTGIGGEKPEIGEKRSITKEERERLKLNDRLWLKESNIDGMRFGLPKIEAIQAQYIRENWLYAFDKFTRCHGNWKDFKAILSNCKFLIKGVSEFSCFRPYTNTMSEETMQKYAEAEYNPTEQTVPEETALYFHKLAELCRENDIKLYMIMAPMYDVYIDSINYDSWTKNILELANSEKVPYLDCNLRYNEIGLTAQDFSDEYSNYHHVNQSGAEKVTKFVLGEVPWAKG